MWHVSSRGGVATLRTAIHLLLTYLLTVSLVARRPSSLSRYGVRYCRAKLTTRCDDGCTVYGKNVQLLTPELRTEFKNKVPLVLDTWIYTRQCSIYVKGSLHAKNQLDPSRRFDKTPTCDRQTDTGPQLIPR